MNQRADITASTLVLIDVQGKLAQVMHDKETLFRNLQILVRGAQILEVPILWCEQNPKGLGPTIPELSSLLTNQVPLAKSSFSCHDHAEFAQALAASGRTQVFLSGIESHVCVFQTALDLAGAGFKVQVVADAVSSRSPRNLEIGLDKIRSIPVPLTCVESLLFEWLRDAAHPKFKEVVKLLK